jgi:hypothetical protein
MARARSSEPSPFGAGARLVPAISELPGVDEHPPSIDLRDDGVTVRLITLPPPITRWE